VLEQLVKFADVDLLPNAVILSDADFLYLVETTCPVQSRVRIDDTSGTVAKGGLFYEELLPADTLLYSLSFLSAERKAQGGLTASQLAAWLKETLPTHLQLGGDATLGRGFCELQWIAKEAQ
jgi:CRISPR-associated protein Cmr4